MEFKKGVFRSYRATTKVHLGQIGKDVHKDDIIDFDGHTLNMGGETFHISTLRSAIKAGWFVPSTDTETVYVPKPASISIRSSVSDDNNERQPMKIKTVNNEERVVSSVGKAKTDTEKVSSEAQEGQVAGKIKTAAKQKTVLTDASSVEREINRLDNSPVKKAVIKKIKHTGDVAEAKTGTELEELLPEATIAKVGGEIPVEWDTKAHWKTRVKKALELRASEPEVFQKVLSLETAKVRKRIEDAIAT